LKLTVEHLKQMAEIIDSAEEHRPLVHAVMQIIDSYGPELEKYPKVLALFGADLTTEVFSRYLTNGFSREEALLLTINQRLSFKEALEKTKK
jgi:hypothetical protein